MNRVSARLPFSPQFLVERREWAASSIRNRPRHSVNPACFRRRQGKMLPRHQDEFFMQRGTEIPWPLLIHDHDHDSQTICSLCQGVLLYASTMQLGLRTGFSIPYLINKAKAPILTKSRLVTLPYSACVRRHFCDPSQIPSRFGYARGRTKPPRPGHLKDSVIELSD